MRKDEGEHSVEAHEGITKSEQQIRSVGGKAKAWCNNPEKLSRHKSPSSPSDPQGTLSRTRQYTGEFSLCPKKMSTFTNTLWEMDV